MGPNSIAILQTRILSVAIQSVASVTFLVQALTGAVSVRTLLSRGLVMDFMWHQILQSAMTIHKANMAIEP